MKSEQIGGETADQYPLVEAGAKLKFKDGQFVVEPLTGNCHAVLQSLVGKSVDLKKSILRSANQCGQNIRVLG